MQKRAILAAMMALAAAGPAAASGPPAVWFEFDSAELTQVDELTLNYAADWLRSGGAERIFIEASADRAGPSHYNLELSRRRGEVVKAALVQRGFPADAISVRAFGESRPIVETADGVPERQNRYAMVFIEAMRAPPQ